jgi:hypothetical protein
MQRHERHEARTTIEARESQCCDEQRTATIEIRARHGTHSVHPSTRDRWNNYIAALDQLAGMPYAQLGAMANKDDVLTMLLLAASPHRVCPSCLAKRGRLRGKKARTRIAVLAETERFSLRAGLCCICTAEGWTIGVSERSAAHQP